MRHAANTQVVHHNWSFSHRNGTKAESVLFLDPEFVTSVFIEQSADNNPTGDDDKIYFFFTELAKEYDLYTKVKVPRVARVCKVTQRLKSD